MSNRFSPAPFYKLVLLFLDCLGFYAAFQLAYYLRLGDWVAPDLWLKLAPVLGFTLVMMYVFDVYKLQDRLHFFRDLLRLALALLLSASMVILGAYLVGLKGFGGLTGRGVLIGAYLFFAIWSAIWRVVLHTRVKGLEQKSRWLVIGTRDYLVQFLKDYEKSPHDVQLVCLTQKRYDPDAGDFGDFEKYVQGSWEDVPAKLKEQWRGIVVATGQQIPEHLVDQLMEIRFQGTRVYDLSDFYEAVWRKVPVFYLQGGWFALSQGFHLLHNPIGLRIKRVGDIFCAGLIMILGFPIMLLAAILVLITSGWPIIYTQKRRGLNGEDFIIYKFRSMKQDAEKHGAQWSKEGDARVTVWGKFMRATRIDELPQIWNIFRGDMSFIGPRPERPEFIKELGEKIPFYNFRHLVRPGLTGWAQVMYPYGATIEDAKEKLQFELYYIKSYSLILDWLVLLKTATVVLFGKGR
ncbi:MAG: exopolysaccharide biosynthesis polyprenyl glycosylphosphotransferase [Bdellovibrionaceae bacterium]|nr:exopolysaccharide biosynthesis polyprenyl glycosylphosphotransferase [Bdellovibrionales bacterium]MCB9086677.1 exopolysaccharide biosynthesis polyprenyl glycosylphosphotransferase [Pseudobdellovibrionaceae bacterium]